MEFRIETSKALRARPSLTADDVARARHAIFREGSLPAVALPNQLLASWQRCLKRGMNVERLNAPEPLASQALDEARCRAEALRLLVEPELEFLTETLADTASQVILADPDGLILDTRGDARAMNLATREALLPGVSWAEDVMGTNAIGTALAENTLLEIWGNEHFHDHHQRICCTAATILDHTGKIVGLLDVSGNARLPRGYARSVVKRAVREIEHRWLMNAPDRFARLRFHPSRACVGSYQEGVLLLDDDRIVGANRTALRWLGGDWTRVGQSLHELFDLAASPADLGRLTTLDGQDFHGSLRLPRRASLAGLGERPPVQAPLPATATVAAPPPAPVPAPRVGAWLGSAHQTMLHRTRRAIDAGLSTIVLGETGVGKEVFAHTAHELSSRSSGPFVAINCAALPENLIEAELFGYGEGAFTGARRKGTPGRILEAHGGILFLDEIGDMPLSLQARLLRVLQDRQVVPLGGGAARPVDCVVMCATHRDLPALIAEGGFRADLFYRLQDHCVQLPAWRELAHDQRQLALAHLWAQAGGAAHGMRLSDAAHEALLTHGWPGNLRQLASTLRTLVALADDGTVFQATDLPATLQAGTGTADAMPRSLEDVGDAAITAALARHNGRVAAAARELGIHRATLYRRIAQLKHTTPARPN